MPFSLENIREELMPGLLVKCHERYSFGWVDSRIDWHRLFAPAIVEPALPTLGARSAFAIGAAAAVIRNPKVSRRGLLAWFR